MDFTHYAICGNSLICSCQIKDEKPPAPIRKIAGDEEDEAEEAVDAEDEDGGDGGEQAGGGGGLNPEDLVDRTNIKLVFDFFLCIFFVNLSE